MTGAAIYLAFGGGAWAGLAARHASELRMASGPRVLLGAVLMVGAWPVMLGIVLQTHLNTGKRR